jgi:hypothetical protein
MMEFKVSPDFVLISAKAVALTSLPMVTEHELEIALNVQVQRTVLRRQRLLLKVGFDQVDRFANDALFNFELSSRLQSETEFHPTRQQYF